MTLSAAENAARHRKTLDRTFTTAPDRYVAELERQGGESAVMARAVRLGRAALADYRAKAAQPRPLGTFCVGDEVDARGCPFWLTVTEVHEETGGTLYQCRFGSDGGDAGLWTPFELSLRKKEVAS